MANALGTIGWGCCQLGKSAVNGLSACGGAVGVAAFGVGTFLLYDAPQIIAQTCSVNPDDCNADVVWPRVRMAFILEGAGLLMIYGVVKARGQAIKALQQVARDVGAEVDETNVLNQILQGHVLNLEDGLPALLEQLNVGFGTAEEANGELRRIATLLEHTFTELHRREANLTVLERYIQTLEELVEDLSNVIGDTDQAKATLADRQADAAEEQESALQRARIFAQQLISMREEVGEMEVSATELVTALTAIQEAVAERDAKIIDLRHTVDNLREELPQIQRSREELERVTQELTTATAQLTEIESRIEERINELRSLGDERYFDADALLHEPLSDDAILNDAAAMLSDDGAVAGSVSSVPMGRLEYTDDSDSASSSFFT